MKKNVLIGLNTALITSLIGTAPAFSASNVELEERINKLEQRSSAASEEAPLGQISDWVTVSGTIETEVGFTSSDIGEDESDISLATAELGVEAKPLDWTTGFMLLSWDDDESELIIDEAHLTLGATESIPYYLSIGKIYTPFGLYETAMISDPITLDIGEIVNNSIVLGAELNGFRVATYAYNGDVEEAGEDDTIQSYGASVGYAMENEQFTIDVGVDWTNNMLESGVLSESVDGAELDDFVPGFAAHAIFRTGPVFVIGEFVTMTDDAEAVDGSIIANELSAFAVEAGYNFEVMGLETTVAVGYQGSDTDSASAYEDFPESKIIGSIGVGLTDNVSVALEYSNAENYSVSEGGDGDTIDTVTMQVAFEF